MSVDSMCCCYGSHGVPEFKAWYAKYKEIDASGFHKQLGIVKSWVSSHLEPDKEGNTVVQVIHFFPKDKMEGIKQAFDMNNDQWKELIANKVIILPVKMVFAELTAEVTYATIMDAGESLSVMAGGHGIPEYASWYKEFRIQEEFMKSLGAIQTVVGKQTEKNASGKDQCFVAHLFRTSSIPTMKKTMRWDQPPFVGGEDYIKKGIIVPPIEFDISTLAGIGYQSAETKTVLLPPTN